MSRHRQNATGFLPEFCKVQFVFFLILISQVLVVLFVLLNSPVLRFDLGQLGLISLFVQWIVLSCAALLCLFRHRLAERSSRISGMLSLLIIAAVTYCCTLLALMLFPGLSNLGEGAQRDWFITRNVLTSVIIGALLLRYFYLQHQWKLQRQAEASARLEALQARIRPHFLFNSINSIASLIAQDANKAEDALLDLAEIFRASLTTQHSEVPLQEELALCRRYLNLEKLRLGERLRIEWANAPIPSINVPPLCLQPLVENAVYHGIQRLAQGGTLKLEIQQKSDLVYILIRNSCMPAATENQAVNSKQSKSQLDASPVKGNQIAIENIQHRLSAHFGGRAIFKRSTQGGWYTVTLRLPI